MEKLPELPGDGVESLILHFVDEFLQIEVDPREMLLGPSKDSDRTVERLWAWSCPCQTLVVAELLNKRPANGFDKRRIVEGLPGFRLHEGRRHWSSAPRCGRGSGFID